MHTAVCACSAGHLRGLQFHPPVPAASVVVAAAVDFCDAGQRLAIRGKVHAVCQEATAAAAAVDC